MQLHKIMTTGVEVIEPSATLLDASKRMRDLDTGVLPVCDGGRLVGMITDRDITVRATARSCDPASTLVRDCMTPDIAYCFEDESEDEAERIMAEKKVRRLPVLNREKQLIGIVSLGDLAVKAGHLRQAGETLRDISAPAQAA